jgi:hypothetical protein
VVVATSKGLIGQINGYQKVGEKSFRVEKASSRKEKLEKKWDLDFEEGERLDSMGYLSVF